METKSCCVGARRLFSGPWPDRSVALEVQDVGIRGRWRRWGGGPAASEAEEGGTQQERSRYAPSPHEFSVPQVRRTPRSAARAAIANARTSSAASGCSTTPLSRLPANAGTRTHSAGAASDNRVSAVRSVAPCSRPRQAIAGARLQRCRTFEKCKGHDAPGLGRRLIGLRRPCSAPQPPRQDTRL